MVSHLSTKGRVVIVVICALSCSFKLKAQILSSHGGSIERIAVSILPKNGICFWSEDVAAYRDSLEKHFNGAELCFINHLIIPDWQIDCSKSGIEGLLDTASQTYFTGKDGTCDLKMVFSHALEEKELWCALKSKDTSSLYGSDELQLKASLDEWFVESFAQPDSVGFLPGCRTVATTSTRFRNFCASSGLGFNACITLYASTFRTFLRDFLLVDSIGIMPWTPNTISNQDIIAHTRYLLNQCACEETAKAKLSNVWFQGGDILVSDSFAVIGKNILIDYLIPLNDPNAEKNRTNALKDLGLDGNLDTSTTSFDCVKASIKKELFPNKEVHFLGVDDRIFLEGAYADNDPKFRSYQPTYHIDMFIALIGEVKEDTFTILLAKPDLKYLNQTDRNNKKVKEYFKHLNIGIDSIEKQLVKFVGQYSSKVKIVKVPMLAKPSESISGGWVFNTHYAFVNGVSFIDSSGKSTFAYPDFIERSPTPFNGMDYKGAKKDFEKALRGADIIPAALPFEYQDNTGFDCSSIVLKRLN